MSDKEIVKIAVENIYQHPDNPRTDLGDLSELSESKRKASCRISRLSLDIGMKRWSGMRKAIL